MGVMEDACGVTYDDPVAMERRAFSYGTLLWATPAKEIDEAAARMTPLGLPIHPFSPGSISGDPSQFPKGYPPVKASTEAAG